MQREDWAQTSPADLAALGAILHQYRPELLAMVQRRLDPALAGRLDAEDILSEAFLQARRRWHRCKDEALRMPRPWLYRIVRDCLIEAWRVHQRGPRNYRRDQPWPEQSSAQLVLGLVDPSTSPSQQAARADLRDRMQQLLQALPEKDREILWMRHYDQLSYQEAAAVLGISENAAMVRHARALQRLRQEWQRLYPGEGLSR
jgi:RNA polymerase sigma-70 factor (ECF subfamily)